MTPADILDRAIQALAGVGLTEAKSPLGVSNQPAPQMGRSFSVLPVGIDIAGDRGRATIAGFRVRQSLEVTLAHKPTAGSGMSAPEQALRDTHLAIRALVAPGAAVGGDGPVEVGSVRHAYAGAGAYLLTTIPIAVSYNLDLRPEQPV